MSNISLENIIYKSALLLLAGVFLVSPLATHGYFSDPVEATGASLTAGTLEMALSPSKSAVTISTTATDTMTFSTTDIGSIAGQYKVTATPTACAAGFWNGVDVTLNKAGVLYDGALGTLLATSTTDGVWTLDVAASSSLVAANNETCSFDITVSSWQGEFTNDVSGGFTDTNTFALTITFNDNTTPLPTSDVVLNEVYPNPDTASSSPLNIEWIELYNGTGSAIDVAGFIIGEMSGATEDQHTLVADCTGYPPSTHMQPYGTNNTVIAPGGLLVVEFCGTASYLNDGGDTVTLYNASSIQLDLYTYTPSTMGKSIARIPDGSVWVDPVPTPGTKNTATAAELLEAGWSQAEVDKVLGTKTEQAGIANFTFVTDVGVGSTSSSSFKQAATSTLTAGAGAKDDTKAKVAVGTAVGSTSSTTLTTSASTTDTAATGTPTIVTPKAPASTTADVNSQVVDKKDEKTSDTKKEEDKLVVGVIADEESKKEDEEAATTKVVEPIPVTEKVEPTGDDNAETDNVST